MAWLAPRRESEIRFNARVRAKSIVVHENEGGGGRETPTKCLSSFQHKSTDTWGWKYWPSILQGYWIDFRLFRIFVRDLVVQEGAAIQVVYSIGSLQSRCQPQRKGKIYGSARGGVQLSTRRLGGKLTECNAPKYDAVARKRKRHRVNIKQESTYTNSNDNTITHRDVLTNSKMQIFVLRW